MQKITGRTISDATIELDGYDWQGCTFVRSRLVYAGGPLGWSNNRLEDGCDLALVGGASMGYSLAQKLPLATSEQFAPMRLASEFKDN